MPASALALSLSHAYLLHDVQHPYHTYCAALAATCLLARPLMIRVIQSHEVTAP